MRIEQHVFMWKHVWQSSWSSTRLFIFLLYWRLFMSTWFHVQ